MTADTGIAALRTPFGHPALGEAWDAVAEGIFERESAPDLFNPYRDRVDGLDRDDAATIRRANLRSYMASYGAPPELFLLAEAPGPWGCRFSGVPITAEVQLVDSTFPLAGVQSSLVAEPHTEYSAGIFWRLLAPWFPHFFVWNCVPLHPHRPGEPLTIRTPRTTETREFESLVGDLVRILAPRRILAIGRKAEQTLPRLDLPCTYVRHPSQGGAKLFAEGVHAAITDIGIEPG